MCLLGDINTDLSRCTSWHTKALTRFIEHESSYITLNHSCADVSYTYCNSHNNVFSTIDHIFISQNLCDYVVKYCSLCDEIDNQSDHVPLVMALSIESETELMNVSKKIYTPKSIWKKTNSEHINDYRMRLDDCLLFFTISFTLPFDCLQCTDLVCTNNEHVESVQILHDNIISAMIDASVNIPSTKQNKKHKIPGWNENVQHSKEIALFWRSIWLNNNSPRQGVVADIMQTSRTKYHYCIREVKKNELLHKKQAMARSIAENNSRNLWTECRKIRQK